MQQLNFPSYQFKLKSSENKQLIFDKIRKKYVVLTPEEWVRQHLVNYLITEKKYPIQLIAVEKQLVLNGRKKRFDVLIYNSLGLPFVIIECKAPSVKITQKTFDQIVSYNMHFDAQYLILSNGINHYSCTLNNENKSYDFLKEIPTYST